jgi:NDP-sugar pyrophosphorylase family protein
MDYAIYDALEAGFNKIVFIIRKAIEDDFREVIGDRIEAICAARGVPVEYAFQELQNLPGGYICPADREKPWGTGHALLACKGLLNGPFVVLNADDYYGAHAYQMMYDALLELPAEGQAIMVGYLLKNTASLSGGVTRGLCKEENGWLRSVLETRDIRLWHNGTLSVEPTGRELNGDTLVSMNLFGFTRRMMDELVGRFPAFLDANLAANPLKCEYFLPSVVNAQLEEGLASVQVLPCEEVWYGVTYREDLASVREAIARMQENGTYTKELWN